MDSVIRIIIYRGDGRWLKETIDRSLSIGVNCDDSGIPLGAGRSITVMDFGKFMADVKDILEVKDAKKDNNNN
jgi:hypothetical protein